MLAAGSSAALESSVFSQSNLKKFRQVTARPAVKAAMDSLPHLITATLLIVDSLWAKRSAEFETVLT